MCPRDGRCGTQALGTDIGVGVTGVAGPDTQEDKPVGTVHIAVDAGPGEPTTTSYTFAQGRDAIKRRAVTTALLLVRRRLLGRCFTPASAQATLSTAGRRRLFAIDAGPDYEGAWQSALDQLSAAGIAANVWSAFS